MVKIYRTLKKMEYGKHLTPIYSDSFTELSEILLQNYKDSSSINSSVIGGRGGDNEYHKSGPV